MVAKDSKSFEDKDKQNKNLYILEENPLQPFLQNGLTTVENSQDGLYKTQEMVFEQKGQ